MEIRGVCSDCAYREPPCKSKVVGIEINPALVKFMLRQIVFKSLFGKRFVGPWLLFVGILHGSGWAVDYRVGRCPSLTSVEPGMSTNTPPIAFSLFLVFGVGSLVGVC